VGDAVEAIDGSIGKIAGATLETDSATSSSDTGPWIFGKKVMLPAGVLKSVDDEKESVFVNHTKDEIKNAPEFDGLAAKRRDIPHGARLVLRPGRPWVPQLGLSSTRPSRDSK